MQSGRCRIIKLFLDGSPQVRTAWLRKPYVGESHYCGYPTRTDEEVEAQLRVAVADLVILDRDPLQVPPEEIKDIRVLCTIKEDQVLYRA